MLGLTFGFDPLDLSLKAPFVGRIGAGITAVLLIGLFAGTLLLRR